MVSKPNVDFVDQLKSYANRNIGVCWEDCLCLNNFIQQMPKNYFAPC